MPELVQLVGVGRQETMIFFWGAVGWLPPVFWNCRRNPYIITVRVILKLGEIIYVSWALRLGFIISCGSWWAGSKYLDRHKRWCPIPSITDSVASSPVRRNKQWKSVFGFKRTKTLFNYSSTVGCILLLPLEWANTFPTSFLRIDAPAVFPVTKCWQSFCSARGSSDSKADVRAALMKLLISRSQNFT